MLLLKIKFRTIFYMVHKVEFAVSTCFKSLDVGYEYYAMENLAARRLWKYINTED